jgi:hypothetical protein
MMNLIFEVIPTSNKETKKTSSFVQYYVKNSAMKKGPN